MILILHYMSWSSLVYRYKDAAFEFPACYHLANTCIREPAGTTFQINWDFRLSSALNRDRAAHIHSSQVRRLCWADLFLPPYPDVDMAVICKTERSGKSRTHIDICKLWSRPSTCSNWLCPILIVIDGIWTEFSLTIANAFLALKRWACGPKNETDYKMKQCQNL